MSTLDLASEIGALGRPLTLAGNRRTLLADPGDLWILARGRLEVFAVAVEGGRPVGPRHHLLSLSPGEGVPTLPPGGAPAPSLLAVAAEESTLVRVRWEDLGAVPQLAVDLVDRVLSPVLGALAARGPRRIDTFAEPGVRLHVSPGQTVGSRSSVLWTGVPPGTSFGGVPLADGSALQPVPLGAGTWVEVSTETDLEFADTACLHLDGRLGQALAGFTEVLRACVAVAVTEDVKRQDEQRTARTTADARARSAFLRELLEIVVPGAPAPSAPSGEDALFEACRAVGRASGIQIRRPAGWQMDRGLADPLGAICSASRIRHRRIVLRGEWWKSDVGALLCYRGQEGAPVAVLRGRDGKYEIFDPAASTRLPVDEAVRAELQPFGYMFYRSLPDRSLSLKDLFAFGFEGLSWSFRSIALLAAMSGLLGLFLPMATRFVFDSVIPSARPGQLLQLFVGLTVVALSAAAFELVRGIAVLRIEAKGGTSMQAALFDRLLKLPPRFFRRFAVGDLVTRVGGIGQVQSLLSGTAVTAILGGLTASLNLVLLFVFDWRLAALGLAWVALALLYVGVCGWLSVRVQGEVQDMAGRLQGFVFQLVSGITKLRSAGAEDRALAQWGGRYAAKVRLERRAATIQSWVTVFNDLLPLVTSVVLFSGVGLLVSRGHGLIDTASFIAFNAALGTFMAAAIATANTLIRLVQAVPLMKRVVPILLEQPEVQAQKPDPGELTGHIEGRHLNFRYDPGGPLVLDDVTFEADPGEFVAFVGPSGSGKSTTLRLLLGFEQPASGTVYYDGQDLASVDVSAVRRQMGVVLQTSRLMSGDIFTNIVGAAPLTHDDAWAAAEMAGFADDIRTFPMGLNTVVSEGGGTLSGGQRQRLLIARALAARPRIILFDEATSALDNRTQKTVSESLDRMHATRIVIAHRLTTIQNADRIYVMVKGRVVEVGSYDELMRTEGVFYRLAARQLA